MLELAQAREGRRIELAIGHRDVLKQAPHLPRSPLGGPLAAEGWQDSFDLVERHPVAAIITTVAAEFDFAIGKYFTDGFGDLAHPVVIIVVANVEYFVG